MTCSISEYLKRLRFAAKARHWLLALEKLTAGGLISFMNARMSTCPCWSTDAVTSLIAYFSHLFCSVTKPAKVKQWTEADDEVVQDKLYWRQAFDCQTAQESYSASGGRQSLENTAASGCIEERGCGLMVPILLDQINSVAQWKGDGHNWVYVDPITVALSGLNALRTVANRRRPDPRKRYCGGRRSREAGNY